MSNILSFIQNVDLAVKGYALNLHTPYLDGIAKLITLLGSLAGMTIISLLVSALLATRRRTREAVFLYLNFFLTNFLMSYLKMQIGRNRPVGALVEVTGYSFPSGHAMVSMAFYGFMALLVPRDTSWGRIARKGLFLLIFLIGCTRIYLRVHYLSDVLAGWILGALCLFISRKSLAAAQNHFPQS